MNSAALQTVRGELHVTHAATTGEWDAFVRAQPDGTFCHLAGWSRVLERTMYCEPHLLEARDDDGALAGVLPLYLVHHSLLGEYLVSVPFLNYGGALGDEHARFALTEEAVRLARQMDVKALELRSRVRFENELAGLTPSDRKITVIKALPCDADALWKSLPSKLRSQVRRPMKEGMTCTSGASEVDAFYDVFATNMRDLGTPVLPRAFFHAAAAEFHDTISFVVVRHEGRPVAAGCGFIHGTEFEITWASSLREVNSLAPNMLLYWELMKHAIDRGATHFNFGRCTPGGGTHRFKKQWGADDVPLGWSTWSRSGDAGTPKPDKPVFRLATSIWQRMPLWAANRIGPALSRGLP